MALHPAAGHDRLLPGAKQAVAAVTDAFWRRVAADGVDVVLVESQD